MHKRARQTEVDTVSGQNNNGLCTTPGRLKSCVCDSDQKKKEHVRSATQMARETESASLSKKMKPKTTCGARLKAVQQEWKYVVLNGTSWDSPIVDDESSYPESKVLNMPNDKQALRKGNDPQSVLMADESVVLLWYHDQTGAQVPDHDESTDYAFVGTWSMYRSVWKMKVDYNRTLESCSEWRMAWLFLANDYL